jgi:hypothetical protein
MNIRRANLSDTAAVQRISAEAYTPAYQAICGFVPKPALEDYRPRIAIAAASLQRQCSTLSDRPLRSATMASHALKLPLQGDERGLLRQEVLRCHVPARHMREVSAGILPISTGRRRECWTARSDI